MKSNNTSYEYLSFLKVSFNLTDEVLDHLALLDEGFLHDMLEHDHAHLRRIIPGLVILLTKCLFCIICVVILRFVPANHVQVWQGIRSSGIMRISNTSRFQTWRKGEVTW